MPLITTAVEAAYIGDQRIRTLGLHFQRCDQGILGLDHDAVAPALNIDANGELRLHGGTLLFESSQD